MVVVLQHRLKSFHVSVANHAVLTTQTDVEKPQQIVDLFCLFTDAETSQYSGLRNNSVLDFFRFFFSEYITTLVVLRFSLCTQPLVSLNIYARLRFCSLRSNKTV